MQRAVQMRQDLQRQVAAEIAQRTSDNRIGVEEGRRIGAGLDDEIVGLLDRQQDAMRLDRACEMNLFALAIRKSSVAEGWRR